MEPTTTTDTTPSAGSLNMTNGSHTPPRQEAATHKEAPTSPKPTTTLPDKRPSPLRQKHLRIVRVGSANDEVACKTPPRRTASRHHLHKDTVCLNIPLEGETLDLGPILKQAKQRRIQGLYKAYPALKPVKPSPHTTTNTEPKAAGQSNKAAAAGESTLDEEDDASDRKPKSKRPKQLANVPRPSDFGNMMEYLEAKYVQGVMVDDEDGDDDLDEGAGSVYSETSFLDDRDLQRTVAEQVLAHSTATKLELQSNEEFFVNVGNLEVEESELTQANYDPVNDKADIKKTKKRKPKEDNTTTKTTVAKKKKASPDENDKPNNSHKAVTSTASNLSASPASNSGDGDSVEERHARVDELYKALVGIIQNATPEELPRRKTKEKVALTCPADKNPGDTILFSNPHVPGQRLKVKIPPTTAPGETFRVTVPVAPFVDDGSSDHNKLSREFYDTLDDYSRAYDGWCDAKGQVAKASGDSNYAPHLAKREKYDQLVTEFPSDLKTPVDVDYMKKLLRRARQNRSKREQTAAARTGIKLMIKAVNADKEGQKPAESNESISLPVRSTKFMSKRFDAKDFQAASSIGGGSAS